MFSYQRDEVQKEIERRKAYVNWCAILVSLVTILLYIACFACWWCDIFTGYYELVFFLDVIYLGILVIVTATLTFSLYRIRKYSKMLVANKVFANEWLMLVHLSCFTILTITTLVAILIGFNLSETDDIFFMNMSQLR